MNPLILPQEDQTKKENPFDSMDLTGVPFVNSQNTVLDSANKSMGVDPNTAADIIKLSNKFDKPMEYVNANLDSAKKADSIPSPFQVNDLFNNNPITYDFLKKPLNMAVAKDDIENLKKTEKLTADYSFGDLLWKSFKVGLDRGVNASLARIPALAINAALYPSNLVNKAFGLPELQAANWVTNNPIAKYYEEGAKRETVPQMDIKVLDNLLSGNPKEMAKGLLLKTAEASPATIAALAFTMAGAPNVGIGFMGATTTASTMSEDLNRGLDPVRSMNDALTQGMAMSLGSEIGQVGIFKNIQASIAKQFGEDVTRKTFAEVARLLTESFGRGAFDMGIISTASNVSSMAVGNKPVDLKEAGKDILDQMIIGGFMGSAMTAPSAAVHGIFQKLRSTNAMNYYKGMEAAAQESALKSRLPDAHDEFIKDVTSDPATKNIYITADAFETYWQSQNIAPEVAAKEIGIDPDAYISALEHGDNISIPYEVWTRKMAGTPHYANLAGDIKFDPNDFTANQAKEASEMASKQLERQYNDAISENPEYKQAFDTIYNDVKGQLDALGNKKIKSDEAATLAAKMAVTQGLRRGVDPVELSKQVVSRIVGSISDMPVSGATLEDKLVNSLHDEGVGIEGLNLNEKRDEIARLNTKYNGDTKFVVASQILGEQKTDEYFSKGKLPTFEELYGTKGLRTQKPTKESIESLAKKFQSDAQDKYDAETSSDLATRISKYGKIRWTEDLKNLGDVNRSIIPIGIWKKIFTTDPNAEGYDAIAQAMGMDGNDLLAQITSYAQQFKSAKKPESMKYYRELAAKQLSEESRSGAIGRAQDKTDLGKIARVLKRIGMETSPTDLNTSLAEANYIADQEAGLYNQGGINTKSEAFKKWFGDSKVVDENGQPLVVYHATEADFKSFDPKRRELGFHFAESPKVANERIDGMAFMRGDKAFKNAFEYNKGSNIKPVYLSLQNPLDIVSDLGDWSDMGMLKEYLGPSNYEIFTNEELNKLKTPNDVREALISKGYDGLVYENNFENVLGEPPRSFIVFNPEQIKSVNNRGTFDPNNPNILFQKPITQSDLFGESIRPGEKPKQTPEGQMSLWDEFSKPKFEVPKQKEQQQIQNNAADQQTLFQSSISPTFFSQVEKTIQDKMQSKGSPDQILGMLKNAPGVKQEELDWLGLSDFIKGKKSVTKEEILNFIRENNVQIQEVMKERTSKARVNIKALDDGRYRVYGPQITPQFYASLSEAEAAKERIISGYGGDYVTDTTKFHRYTLPGGDNYRELLLTLPSEPMISFEEWNANRKSWGKEPGSLEEFKKISPGSESFKSSHFSEPNILAHVRFNDRVDSEGKKVLFIEEVQSDWHQKGRDKGYKDGNRLIDGHDYQWWANERDRLFLKEKTSDAWRIAAKNSELLSGKPDEVPNAPFKKTWHELALKRMLRYAAENGYDKIAWTTGEQQAERYDLSKQVDEIYAEKLKSGSKSGSYDIQIFKDNKNLMSKVVEESDLSGFVGKDLAKKIIDDAPNHPDGKQYSGLDLKVGGEGMKGFYDKIIPEFLNKYAKKWGGKVGSDSIEQPGIQLTKQQGGGRLKPGSFVLVDSEGVIQRGGPDKNELEFYAKKEGFTNYKIISNDTNNVLIPVHSLDITPSMKESVMQGQPLFQAGSENRGAFDSAEKVIAILKKADASTFVHELAHAWLTNIHDYVVNDFPPPEYIDDWGVLKNWLNVKDGQEGLTRDQHEKFARGFEAYLREGKSPSTEVSTIFYKFKKWLTRIYSHIGQLNVELTDDVRKVFDRLVATDQEIEQAKSEIGLDEKFRAEGVDTKLIDDIKKLRDQADMESEQQLLAPQMEEVTPKRAEEVLAERAKVTKEVMNDLNETPEYRTQKQISDEFGGQDLRDISKSFLNKTMSDADIAKWESQAALGGYSSGDELANHLLETPTFNDAVLSEVGKRMADTKDLKDSAGFHDKALDAVHGEKQLELLNAEEVALKSLTYGKKKVAVQKAELEIIRKKARELLASKTVKEAINHRVFYTSEKNAAIKSALALERKKFNQAWAWKRRQKLAHAMAIEAKRISSEMERGIDYLNKFANRQQDMKDMPYGFVRIIDTLLRDHGFNTTAKDDSATTFVIAEKMEKNGYHPAEIANRTGWMRDKNGTWATEKLSDLEKRINENYYAVEFPTILEGKVDSVDGMKVSDFRDLRDTVKAIDSIGRKYERFLGDFNKVSINDAARIASDSIRSNIGEPYLDQLSFGHKYKNAYREKVDAILKLPDSFIGSQVNLMTLMKYLDGGASDGPMQNFVYRVLEIAENNKMKRTEKLGKEFNAIMEKFFTPKELAAYKDGRIFIKEAGKWFSKEEILMMGFNYGNELNKQRLIAGSNNEYTPEIIDAAVEKLSKKDWDFIQSVWDHLETYWPDIKELEMKVNGFEPSKVEYMPFMTKYGEYKGGYFPIAYDYEKSATAKMHAEQTNELYKQYSTAKAHTDQGHTKSRVNYVKRPVRLSFDVVTNHLENVIHDLSYREAVIDTNRFLAKRDLRDAIQNAIGVDGLRAIENHIKSVASDQGEYLTKVDKAMKWFRFQTTFATLGYRLPNFPMDLAGNAINLLWHIGPKRLGRAITDFYLSPSDSIDFIHANSEYMKNRAKTRDRDAYDMSRRWFGKSNAMIEYGFIVQSLADEALSYPLWKESYNNALGEYGHEKAVLMADEAVVGAFGSGRSIDRTAMQRGSEAKKTLTMYFSWLNMMFNKAWLDGKIGGLEYNKQNYGAAIAAISKVAFFAWIAQGINENFWRELMRNNQKDDDEKRKKRVMARFLSQPFSYLWLTKDIAGYAIDRAIGINSDIKTPLQSAAESVINPMADGYKIAFGDKEIDKKYFEELAKAGAILSPYPQQLNTWIFNFIDWMDREGEASWKDLMTRRVKK